MYVMRWKLIFIFGILGFTNVSARPEITDKTGLVLARGKREVTCTKVGKERPLVPTTEEINGTKFYRANDDESWCLYTSYTSNHFLVTSEYFSLEISDDCQWDFLQITENNQSRSSRFCGWEPLTYVSSDNNITFRFKSDMSYEDIGYKIRLQSVPSDDSGCNCSITGKIGGSGSIYNKADQGSSCYYNIRAPEGHLVELQVRFIQFGVVSCDQENIVIRDGESSHGEQIEKLCGDSLLPNITRRVKSAFVEYINLNGGEGERFQIDYTIVENNFPTTLAPTTTPSPVGGDADCSGILEDTDATFSFPEYQNNIECIIVARTSAPKSVVQLRFLKFETEESEDCIFDSLNIYSGERNDSGHMGGPYCGTSLRGKTLISPGNTARMVFKTDESFALVGVKVEVSFVLAGCHCDEGEICVKKDYQKQ